MTDLTNHTEIVKDALEKCAAFRAAFPWPDDQPLSMDIDDRAVGDLFAEAQTLRAECQRLREALGGDGELGPELTVPLSTLNADDEPIIALRTLVDLIDGPDIMRRPDYRREMAKAMDFARAALNPAKDEG